MGKWGSQCLTYAYEFHELGWGADHINQSRHYLSASPVVIVWTVVGQHLFLNLIPNNFIVGTRQKCWCDHGTSLRIICLHSWVWNFIEYIVFYQGDHKNILNCDIDGTLPKYVSASKGKFMMSIRTKILVTLRYSTNLKYAPEEWRHFRGWVRFHPIGWKWKYVLCMEIGLLGRPWHLGVDWMHILTSIWQGL